MKCRRLIHTDGCTTNPPSCMHSAMLSCNDLRCDWLKMRRNEQNPEALIAKRLQTTLKIITCDEQICFANLQRSSSPGIFGTYKEVATARRLGGHRISAHKSSVMTPENPTLCKDNRPSTCCSAAQAEWPISGLS